MLLPALPEMYCCLGSSRKGGYRTWTCSSKNALAVVSPSPAVAVRNTFGHPRVAVVWAAWNLGMGYQKGHSSCNSTHPVM
jgi:hypothetical protein